MTYPGYCQIEVINDSFADVRVFGSFDDGATVDFMFRVTMRHIILIYSIMVLAIWNVCYNYYFV